MAKKVVATLRDKTKVQLTKVIVPQEKEEKESTDETTDFKDVSDTSIDKLKE